MSENRKFTARDTALEVLMQIERANAWSDSSLKRTIAKNGLEGREAALATRLAYGVVRAMVGIAGYGQRHWHSQDIKPEGQ